MDDWVNEWISNGGVCRTVLATPGLLKNYVKKAIQKSHYENMLSQFENSRRLQDIKHDNYTNIGNYLNDKKPPKCHVKIQGKNKT